MMHGRMKSRLLVSAVAAALAPAVPIAATVATLTAATEARAADVQKARCQALAFLASKEGDVGIPKELAFLQLDADEFAIYKSFYLVDKKEFAITHGKTTEVKFRSGNRLGLSLLGNEDKRLKLHAELTSRDGKKKLLGADYSTEDGATLMIGAGSYEHESVAGKLFFAIQCARSD